MPLLSSGLRLEIPIDVLDEDHGGIDDDAKIDGADRQEIGVLAEQHHDDDAEEQRERNVRTDNHRAAQVTEEQPLNEKDKKAAVDEIVQHRRSGHVDELGTVIDTESISRRPEGCHRY